MLAKERLRVFAAHHFMAKFICVIGVLFLAVMACIYVYRGFEWSGLWYYGIGIGGFVFLYWCSCRLHRASLDTIREGLEGETEMDEFAKTGEFKRVTLEVKK